MPVAFTFSYVALWVLFILNTLVLIGVVRIAHHLQQERRGEGQGQIGRKAPKFQAVDLMGTPIGSQSFAGQTRALLFVSPRCQSCVATLDEMELLRRKVEGNVIVICQGSHTECAQLATRFRVDEHVVADKDEKISKLFEVSAVPTAVLLNESDRIQTYGEPLREDDTEVAADYSATAQTIEAALHGDGVRERS